MRETDATHLHAYDGERALATLGVEGQPVAALVLRHHERLDGSSYHLDAKAGDFLPEARILAAAEAYQTTPKEIAPIAPQSALKSQWRGCEPWCMRASSVLMAQRPY